MRTWLTGEVAEWKVLINAVFAMAVVVICMVTYVKTRALIPVLIAGVSGVVGIVIANNSSWMQTRLEQDLNGAPVRIGTALVRSRLGLA